MKSPDLKNRSLPLVLAALLVAGGAALASPSHAALGRGAGGGGEIIARGASMIESLLALVPLQVPSPGLAAASSTRAIDGAVGGVVTAGRFTVIVPPGAFLGSGSVTVSVPNPSVLECELDIQPADRNDFAIPVTLTVDAAGAVTNNPFSLKLGWWDPAQSKWVPVSGSSEDNLTLRVAAPLYHFSKYGVFDSKAGW